MNDSYVYADPLTDRELEILRLKVKRHSNQEIANSLHLSRNTVRWYVSQIYSKLQVANRAELKTCAQTLGLLDEPISKTPTPQQTLPKPITSFIGRENDITDITALLKTVRLLTLTGTGGTGKTRLALKVVDAVQDNYRDGVFFVDLAPLTDPSRVANAIADVLQVIENTDESIKDTLKRV